MKTNLITNVLTATILIAVMSCKSQGDATKEKESAKVEEVAEIENANAPTFDFNQGHLTVINLLKPDAANKAEVLANLKAGLSQTMSKQKGFISSQLHSSLDNNYIINYAQWESGQDLQAAAQLVQGGKAPKMGAAFGKGNPDYHPFAIVESVSASNDKAQFDVNGDYLTIINVLVPNEGVTQDQLISALQKGVKDDVKMQPGFISATIHKSLDNNYVINYAQWKNQEALMQMVTKLQAGEAPSLGAVFGMSQADYHPFKLETF